MTDSDRSDQSVGPATEHDDMMAESSRMPPSATTAMDDSKRVSARKTSDGLIETVIKFAGFAGVVSAGMGIPAVYFHFTRLGFPTQYIDYNLVLSAGILPAAAIVILAVIFRRILRQAHEGGKTPRVKTLFLPLLIPLLPVLFAGMVSMVLLDLSCLLWGVSLPLRFIGFEVSNRQLLYVSTVLGIGALLGYFARERLSQFRLGRWIVLNVGRLASCIIAVNRHVSATVHNATAQSQPASKKIEREKTPEEEANEWFFVLPIVWLLAPALFVGNLYSIKAILYLWDSSLSEILQSATVVWASVGMGIAYALPMSSFVWGRFIACEGRGMKNKGLAIAFASLLLSGVFFITLYSTKIYPELSQAWGGGKLATVTIWVKLEDVSVNELRLRLPGSSVTTEGSVVRIGSVFAFHAGKETTLLIGRSPGAVGGVALPTSSFKMAAWSPGD